MKKAIHKSVRSKAKDKDQYKTSESLIKDLFDSVGVIAEDTFNV